MKRTLLITAAALLVIAALPALAEQNLETVDEAAPAVVETSAEAAADELFVDESEPAEPALTLDVTKGAQEVAWCPYGAPRCWTDDHCDDYCGDPRFGYCFTDTNCCGCSG